jgi:hypothetical protein
MTLKIEVSESNQILIDSVLKKRRTKDFITRLSLKNKYDKDNLQYKIFFYIIPFLEINNC